MHKEIRDNIGLIILIIILGIILLGATYVNIGPTTEFTGDVGVPAGSGYYIDNILILDSKGWSFTHLEDQLFFGELGDMFKLTYDADEDGDIDVAAGGTEKSSWTLYAIPYLSGVTTFGEILIGTAEYALTINAGGDGYDWTLFDLSLYYLKTEIDSLSEVETIYGVDIIDSTELAAFTGQENIVTVGTIGTGTWEGTAIADAYIPNDITINLATLATNFTCTDNESEDLACTLVFVDGAIGSQGAETDGDLTYNPSSGILTATAFAGDLTGSVTGNADTCTTASAGDAAVDFFGAGVDAVTDTTECTDLEGTLLSITTGTLNVAIPEDHIIATMLIDDNAPVDEDVYCYEETGPTGHWYSRSELGIGLATSITDGLILEADLNADEEPADNDILTFDTTGANFSWQTPAELGLITTEVDPTVDTDAEIKAILVDEVTKTGTFTAGRMAIINNASGIIEQGTNTNTEVADAVTKKHAANADTDLDGTFEATFVKKVDTVNVLSDITSAGADIEDAVTKKHTQNTDTTLVLTNALASDHTYSGLTDSQLVGESVVFGDLLYFNWTDKEWKKTDADAAATMPGLRIALESKADGQACKILVMGYIRDDSAFEFTASMVYASVTPGAMSSTAPVDAGDQVQRVGVAKSADILFFNPSIDVGEI